MLTESSIGESPFNQTSHTHYLKHDREQHQRENDFFAQTSEHLTNNNFMHHSEEGCLCKECNCGRHLCKLNVIRPGFTKKTVYKRSYFKQTPIQNVVNHDKEYERLKGPFLELGSIYSEGFKPVKGDELTRPHPEDLLHPAGPSLQLTSYSTEFPGFRGDNQYVKPTNKHAIGYFPLRSKTTYSKEYTKKDNKKDDYKYIPDQLKTGSNWFGKTTYANFYSQPDPEYFAKKVKIIEKLEENPIYNRQYRTTLHIQRPFTRMSSYRRQIHFVLRRYSLRLRLKAPSKIPRLISKKMLTSSRSLQRITQYRTQSIPVHDLIYSFSWEESKQYEIKLFFVALPRLIAKSFDGLFTSIFHLSKKGFCLQLFIERFLL